MNIFTVSQTQDIVVAKKASIQKNDLLKQSLKSVFLKNTIKEFYFANPIHSQVDRSINICHFMIFQAKKAVNNYAALIKTFIKSVKALNKQQFPDSLVKVAYHINYNKAKKWGRRTRKYINSVSRRLSQEIIPKIILQNPEEGLRYTPRDSKVGFGCGDIPDFETCLHRTVQTPSAPPTSATPDSNSRRPLSQIPTFESLCVYLDLENNLESIKDKFNRLVKALYILGK